MPVYGTAQSGGLTALMPGDDVMYLFDGTESLTAPVASIPFVRAYSPSGDDAGTTFEIKFATSPTAVMVIQCADADADASYVTVYTSTNTSPDAYTDIGRSKYYRARLVSQSAGGAVTVTAKR